jgi:hypothetical protein
MWSLDRRDGAGLGSVRAERRQRDGGPRGWEELSPVQHRILHCLYTRHHDGFVRQRHLEQIVGSAQPWVVPFVLQIVGEYVVELLLAIRGGLANLDTPGTAQHMVYGRFIAANPDFFHLTRQRVASYWDCYYRGLYADRRHYPGYTILASLDAAATAFRGQ